MKTFTCNVAQKGFFVGPVHFIQRGCAAEEYRTTDTETEQKRLHAAVQQLREQIGKTAHPAAEQSADANHSLNIGNIEGANRTDAGNAAMAEMVLSILTDESFLSRMEQGIQEQHLSAQAAVRKTADDTAEIFRTMHSEYLRSRQDDIQGIANELIAVLGETDHVPMRERAALAAEEISPAQLLSADEALVGGLLTEKGSANSHAAILAGDRRIPYLYGNRMAVAEAEHAACIILDGEAGLVITDPDPETRRIAETRMAQIMREQAERAAMVKGEGTGADSSCRTKVYANIAGVKDIETLSSSDADGVGLLRTEFLFMEREAAPDEEEQYNAYKAVLEAMGTKPVVIRTMDIGSDKKVPWLALREETNPALGMRGIRVSLEQKDLLHTQLRALLRAGVSGNLKVMFPMITSVWELEEIEGEIRAAQQELEQEGIAFRPFELGIMIETPAAVVCAEEFAEKVSFFSIGTNDLTQYTLAIDREAQGLERYFNPRHEAIFRMIRMTADSGHRRDVKTCVCGRLGADAEALERLIQCGVDSVSVPISSIGAVKRAAAAAEERLRTEKAAEQSMESMKEECAAAGRLSAENPSAISEVSAAADGELIPMEEIPDEAFSSGSLGKCYGILPSNGSIYAPAAGIVSSIAETGHAVTLTDDTGNAFLIHVGIDTVKMGGKPFILHVSQGERVECGQLIMEADIAAIERAGLSPMVIVAALES